MYSSVNFADLAKFYPAKRGHIINVGQPIWALDFLPQPASKARKTQYLAVAGHPSFEARPKLYFPAAGSNVIQLWAIAPHRPKSEGASYISTFISHSWGSCWGLRFCPYGAYGEGRVGLLAGVFGDGVCRVIDVRSEWIGTSDSTVNVRVSQAAWEYTFGEDVLATCVAWKSHTEIVVGCSNGTISKIWLIQVLSPYLIWPILPKIVGPRTQLILGHIPSFYSSISETYIMSIISLAPAKPHFIAISSFDGTTTVFDMRSPESDIANTIRQRGTSQEMLTQDYPL